MPMDGLDELLETWTSNHLERKSILNSREVWLACLIREDTQASEVVEPGPLGLEMNLCEN